MRGVQVVVAGIVLGATAWTGQACAGWVIDAVVKGGGNDRQQTILQANRMKTVTFDGDRPAMAVIVDLDAQTITQVDYRERRYTTDTVQAYVQIVQGVKSGAMQQMEDALKGLPPEQRKMAEEMMRGRMGPGTGGSEPCVEPRIEVRKTGEQATVAGYPAVRHDLLADGKPLSELWLARGIHAWRELDRDKLERFAREMEKLAACGQGQRRGGRAIDAAWRAAENGYPVRTVDASSRTTVEVVKVESRAVPAAELQPPAGFVQKTLQELIGR